MPKLKVFDAEKGSEALQLYLNDALVRHHNACIIVFLQYINFREDNEH